MSQPRKLRPKNKDYKTDEVELFDFIAYDYDKELINKIHKKILKEQKSLNVDEKLKKKWNVVNSICKDVYSNNEIVNLLKLSSGAGKTSKTIQYVLNIIRYTMGFMTSFTMEKNQTAIVLLGQQYKHGVNEFKIQIEKFAQVPINYLVLEGKGRSCLHRFDPLMKIGEKIGLSIDYLCKKCEHKDSSCPYFCKIRELFPPPRVSLCLTVSHQINKFIPIWLTKLGNLIIVIDEDFENAIKTNTKIYLSTLEKNITFLENVIKKEEKKKEPKILYLADFDMLLEFLNLLKKGIIDGLDYKKVKDTLDYLEECLDGKSINNLNAKVWKILEKFEKKTEQLDNIDTKPIILPFKRFYFYRILSFIKNYSFMKRSNPANIDKWLEKTILRLKVKIKKKKIEDKTKKKKVEDTTPQYCLGMLYYDFHSIIEMLDTGKVLKLIINDATASVLKLQKIFGDRLFVYNRHLVSNNLTIYQLKQKRRGKYNREYAYYPQTSIQRYSTLRWLKEDVKAFFYAFPEIEQHLFVSRDIKIRTKTSDDQPTTRLWNYLAEELNGTFVGDEELKKWFISLEKEKIISLEKYPLAGTNDYENYKSVILFGTPDISSGVIERESTLFDIDPIKYRREHPKTDMNQAMGRIMRGTEDKVCLELSGLNLGYHNVENVKVITFKNHKELQTYFKELGDKKRNVLTQTEFEKIKDFLNKNKNQITINDYMELFGTSYYISKNKLDTYVINKMIKIKTVGSSHKGVYYI